MLTRIYYIILLFALTTLYAQYSETSLKIISDPSDAVVYINGDEKGVTPIKLKLKPGKITIRLEQDEYAPKEMSITLRQGQRRTIQMQLDELAVNVAVSVNPGDADVIINGVEKDGRTNYLIPSGINTFYFEKPGYGLPLYGMTKITVFDVLGNRIIDLVDGFQNAGHFSVVWTGKNNLGQNVSAGIYYYKIEAENFSSVKKMIFLK